MKNIFSVKSRILKAFLIMLIPILSFSKEVVNAENTIPKKSFISFDMDTALFFIAVTLAFVILIMIRVMRSLVRFHFNSIKLSDTIKFLLIGIAFIFSLQYASAEGTVSAFKPDQHFVFSNQGWCMLLVIALELYVLFSMTRWFKYFTGIEKYESLIGSTEAGRNNTILKKLNKISQPWLLTASGISILFAFICLLQYHISSPSMDNEINIKKSGLNKMEDLKKEANLIDENTVTLLKEGEYEEGKSIFKATCAVCHGDKGQGLVGPNMTDDYWLHGGSVKDIFKTIKYGVPDKGMISWKENYSPNQIAQLTSYIKSLRGTKPADPKAPQGELYKEKASTFAIRVRKP